MNKTSIEWTDYTWNPIRARRILASIECDCPCDLCGAGQIHCGKAPCDARRSGTFCTRISPGCTNCYASVINKRFGNGLEYTVPNLERIEFYLDEKILAQPLKQKKPARIFVGDMFDLFHEQIPVAFIAEVLRVALKTPRHTFQFLTKRAERMRVLVNNAQEHWGVTFGDHMHFGVSVEDEERACERIPDLKNTRACVRFLSVEPMLEAVDLESPWDEEGNQPLIEGVDWVICGGESGPGARPFNLAWAESLLAQCRDASVPFFMKQLGSVPMMDDSVWRACCDAGRVPLLAARNAQKVPARAVALSMRDRKGGDPSEWPESLRVREFPSQKAEALTA